MESNDTQVTQPCIALITPPGASSDLWEISTSKCCGFGRTVDEAQASLIFAAAVRADQEMQ